MSESVRLRDDGLNRMPFRDESPGAVKVRMAAELESLRRSGIVVGGLAKALGIEALKMVEPTTEQAGDKEIES